MNLELTGKVFLVAGSSRGIGKAIAQTLYEEGAHIVITGRRRGDLETFAAEFHDSERVSAFEGDLTDSAHIGEVYANTIRRFGQLDGLIANLGSGSGEGGWQQSDEEWDRLFRINFQASVKLAQGALPHLIGRNGTIVFISSITGVEATGAPLPYSAAKAALLNYSKNLSQQLGAKAVRVNCVAPGNILFPGGSWERRLTQNKEAVLQNIEQNVPLRRFGTPSEIAALVTFLCSTRASFITGACFVADGGQTRGI